MKYGLTNTEAIEAIRKNYPPENYSILREALDMAIEALEKQIPLEPVETWDDGFVCPICNRFVTCQKWKNGKPYNVEFKYCPTCGQKLKQEVE